MRKTLLYIVLLGILGFGVWYFIFSDKDTFGVSEAGFTITDTGNIGKIYMVDPSGKSLTLERDGAKWKLNGKYDVIPRNIDGFLKTLRRQMPMYPVPKGAHNNVVKSMAGGSVKVELYTRGGQLMRSFLVGGQANDNKGTYMLIKGANKPYVVQIPGFEGYLTPRYSVEIKDWRDRTVTDLSADEIEKVSVSYPAEPLNSFVIENNQGNVSVEIDPMLTKGKQLNESRAKLFLTYFEKLYCEGYINGVYQLDSIIAAMPKRAVIDVKGKSEEQHIEVYWMPINRRSKNMLSPDPTVPEGYDADRFYATINNFQDTIIIQRGSFEKIFRMGYQFYEQDQ